VIDKIVLAMALGLAAIVSLILASQFLPIQITIANNDVGSWQSMSAGASCTDSGCGERIIRNCEAPNKIAILRENGRAWVITVEGVTNDSCKIIMLDTALQNYNSRFADFTMYECLVSMTELSSELRGDSFDQLVSNIIDRDRCGVSVP
jgi:hypothetical protein